MHIGMRFTIHSRNWRNIVGYPRGEGGDTKCTISFVEQYVCRSDSRRRFLLLSPPPFRQPARREKKPLAGEEERGQGELASEREGAYF